MKKNDQVDHAEIQKIASEEDILSVAKASFKPKIDCKFCQSPFREEAEQIYEETHNAKKVWQFLSEKGLKVCYLPILNHLKRHYSGGNRISAIREWAEEVAKYYNPDSDIKKEIVARMTIIKRLMLLVNAQTNEDSIEDLRKTAQTTNLLNTSINDLEDKLKEIEKENEPIEKTKEMLQYLIVDKMKKEGCSEETKRELMSILEDLSKSEIIVEASKK